MRMARIYDPAEPDDGLRVLADRLRYEHELDEPVAAKALRDLRQLAEAGTVTLLTSAKDVEHGHLVVLRRLLENRS